MALPFVHLRVSWGLWSYSRPVCRCRSWGRLWGRRSSLSRPTPSRRQRGGHCGAARRRLPEIYGSRDIDHGKLATYQVRLMATAVLMVQYFWDFGGDTAAGQHAHDRGSRGAWIRPRSWSPFFRRHHRPRMPVTTNTKQARRHRRRLIRRMPPDLGCTCHEMCF
jgi:hypothetical protein